MKKLFAVFVLTLFTTSVFGISFKNNTYQKLADEYTRKAQYALDAGQYADSFEYSQLAEENAQLSRAYIEAMMAKTTAEETIAMARNQLKWAESIDAQNIYPMAYTSAKENLENAEVSYDDEDYEQATEYAKLCLASLDGIKEVTPLPAIYIVRPWVDTKDCYWNISGRPYIYNNPLLWENLYQANKSKMPRPEDPNLILPGMKMDIPSLTGEYRSGTYDPKKEYEPYN